MTCKLKETLEFCNVRVRSHTHTHTRTRTRMEHLIHACRILEPQRSSLVQHITTRGGIWPPQTTNCLPNI